MKIGIDINEIYHGERAIRRYVVNLTRSLAELTNDYGYQLLSFCFRKPAHAFPEMQLGDRFHQKKWRVPASMIVKCWERLGLPSPEFFTGKIDLFHAPGSFVPHKYSKPLLVTVHSMHHMRIPEYLEPQYLKTYQKFMDWTVRQGDYFITVSETMRQDFIAYYGIKPDRVKAIPLGIGSEFKVASKMEAKRGLMARFGIDRPYLLYVGGIQIHKNVHRIVEAFYLLKKKKEFQSLCLVLAGDRAKGSEHILETIKKLGIGKDVILTGYLQQESGELEMLYAGAELFIFPTLWEGWSSPPLEAMASGLPVIVSDIAPHRENCGNAAMLVAPDQAEKMAHAAEQLLSDQSLYEDYRARGLKHAAQFTWRKMAEETLRFYEWVKPTS